MAEKPEYHGITHLVPMWALPLWRRFMCPRGYHALDEVLAYYDGYHHALVCDACELGVEISLIVKGTVGE